MKQLITCVALVLMILLVFAGDEAAAMPDADGVMSAAHSTLFAPAADPARLDRRVLWQSWQQYVRAEPKRQPTVGQYSCIPCQDPCWRWVLSLPVWVPGIDASAAKGNVSVDGSRRDDDLVDKSGSILSDLEFAFVGAVTVRRGRWGAGVDFLTASVTSTADFTIGNGVVSGEAGGTLSATIARARIDYLYARGLAPWKLGRCGSAEHRLYLGARVYDVSVQADARSLPGLTADIGDTWVDPIVGFESLIPFARNWSVALAGDVGGWGIDGNWSYSVLGGVSWRFANRWGITFAYNLLDLQRSFGPAVAGRKIDLNLRGPQIALHFFL